ncbi:hypothetical protein X975_18406, partial [Stegodyphus mimosarum]
MVSCYQSQNIVELSTSAPMVPKLRKKMRIQATCTVRSIKMLEPAWVATMNALNQTFHP